MPIKVSSFNYLRPFNLSSNSSTYNLLLVPSPPYSHKMALYYLSCFTVFFRGLFRADFSTTTFVHSNITGHSTFSHLFLPLSLRAAAYVLFLLVLFSPYSHTTAFHYHYFLVVFFRGVLSGQMSSLSNTFTLFRHFVVCLHDQLPRVRVRPY